VIAGSPLTAVVDGNRSIRRTSTPSRCTTISITALSQQHDVLDAAHD
jgi:hypothetical protein